MKNLPSWGKHLVVDAAGCSEAINDKEAIKEFNRKLVKEIQMVPFGEPQVEWFADHDPDKAGYSSLQWIQTSAIVGHFVPQTWTAHIDVFSCMDFDTDKVIEVMKEFFEIKAWNIKEFSREAPDLNSV
jgi:S-adenosylmethionine/arginine decarboxylase-like enzyme